ncbi:zinc ribbon domain-containing protein [bacterium]|nr:zinc ribbon domain-containing protein [bacterium]
MPLYEYRCTGCGNVSEFLETRAEAQPHACPGCGSQPMERIFSAFGVEVGHGTPSGPSSCAGGGCSGGSCPFS